MILQVDILNFGFHKQTFSHTIHLKVTYNWRPTRAVCEKRKWKLCSFSFSNRNLLLDYLHIEILWFNSVLSLTLLQTIYSCLFEYHISRAYFEGLNEFCLLNFQRKESLFQVVLPIRKRVILISLLYALFCFNPLKHSGLPRGR